MYRASMPVAPVNKDRYLRAPKDDVGFAPQIRQRPFVDSIPKPSRMQTRSQRNLYRRVPSPLALHARRGRAIGGQIKTQRSVSGHLPNLAPETHNIASVARRRRGG